MQAKVLAIRHAPTRAPGLCVGDAEVRCALSATESAARMGLAAAGQTFCAVWSSPRSRCLQPARLLAAELRLPLRVDDRLRELSLGEWQGKPWSVIEANDNQRLQHWMAHWIDCAAPGGETTEQLLRRVSSWWNGLPSGCHLLVAHAGVVRSLRVLVRGTPWATAMEAPVPHLMGEWFARLPSCTIPGPIG